ncbi:acetate--CoA ligase family protein [Dactylosporangium sp. NPDC048998]|uniref:acetate--CoA ligase family protein n=1 Tax=Dactylosporangium sp. NPDC048998 TaxID=3363976 RepID=UPI00370FC2B6
MTETIAIERPGLDALFAPRRCAVLGASRQPGKLGAVMGRSLAAAAGGVALINSRAPDPRAGIHGDLRQAIDVGGPIDFAAICLPAPACPDAVREAGAAGVRAVLVCAGGFAESGPSGLALQDELRRAAAEAGVRLLGPNTSGFVVPGRHLVASFVPAMSHVLPGRIAVVAASGGVHHTIAFMLAAHGHGISLGVGLGNAVDVGTADVLDYLTRHEETAAVALHVESITDAAALLPTVERLVADRPVVASVVGRHDIGAFARSHTGALATSWRTARAALRQAGAVLVDDERALIDAVVALSHTRLRPSPRPGIALVTAQAGPGLITLDQLRGRGVHVPELAAASRERLATVLPPLTYQANPVDTGRPGPGFADVLDITAEDPGVDLVGVYALIEPGAVDLPAALAARTRPESAPTIVGIGGAGDDVSHTARRLLDAGIVCVSGPTALATALAALADDAKARDRLRRVPDRDASRPSTIGFASSRGWDEQQIKIALAGLGLNVPPGHRCASRDEARQALAALATPVAAKILRPIIAHKTDAGGVCLNLHTDADIVAAWDALAAIGAREVLVEAMSPAGVDLVVGARRDPAVGPIVLVGLGGTAAEVLGDVAVRLAPLSVVEAATMIEDLAGRALLNGHRGGPVLRVCELAETLALLGDVLTEHPDVSDIEINPLRLTHDGLWVLDALTTHLDQGGH